MAFSITKEVELDCGHRVPTHGSKCKNLHGHRYRVVVELESDEVTPDQWKQCDSGMVADFGDVKRALMEAIHDQFDHKLILWVNDELRSHSCFENLLVGCGIAKGVVYVPCIPTAENLAAYWYGLMEVKLHDMWPQMPFRFVSLTVWETPTSSATFYPE